MNFFEHQAQARAQTRRMVVLFLLAVGVIVLAVDTVILMVVAGNSPEAHTQGFSTAVGSMFSRHDGLLVATTAVVLGIIAISALFKTASLRRGGGALARSLGGTRVPPDTTNPRLRRLRNIVEEIAIASGVPCPEVYVLEKESGINAFAAGYTPADAAVTVTQGCMDKLSRDELQGVIAHEFSHVLNGDMRLNIKLMGVLYGILVLHIIGREVLDAMPRRSTRSSSNGKGGDPMAAIALVAFALMVIGLVGVFFGRLIKAGVSRSREFLADASAVQFTRQTGGIAGALKKIAGLDQGSKLVASAKAEEASHMLFGDGIGYSALFATHPPVFDRIRRLEPSFQTSEILKHAAEWNDPSYTGLLEEEPGIAGLQAGAKPGATQAGQLAERVGQPGSEDYAYAQIVHAALPDELVHAVQNSAGVMEVVCGLLLDPETVLRGRQLALVEQTLGANARKGVAERQRALEALEPGLRLPLVALGFPALRHQPRDSLIRFLGLVSKLVNIDGKVGVSEFCLGRVLRSGISDALSPAAAQVTGRGRLPECATQIETLFSVLAHYGTQDEAAARRAFAAGVSQLLPKATLQYRGAVDLKVLDNALFDLNKLLPAAKSLLVEAMMRTMAHDGRFTVAESELLRAVCAALHCPLPPLVKAT